ncbi:MAG TPA: MBG domain-containing protein, partial [Kiritimatiellia bacterium]|nr:MBG domain-containing protein [Kiritimatiellia bacterium]
LTNLTFTGTGWVAIVATQAGDGNWNPAPPVTNVFLVSKMPAAVFLNDLAQTYDGTAREASATTEPPGLAVEFTYDGLAWAPTNAGTYAVTGILVEAHWEGWTNGMLVVAPADQSIDFPAIPDQFVTNVLPLVAAADSGLPVEFALASGPATFADPTSLAFSGTGAVAVVASQAGDANWNPAPPVTNVFEAWGLYVLTIVAAHGEADPPAGIYTNLFETMLTNSIAVPAPAGGTQFVCTGWALTGHEPTAGTATNFTLVVTNDATLVWLWQTNFWLETSAGLHGSAAPDSSWQPAHLPAVLVATPDRYYHFDHWTNSASGTNNPFALIMDRPKSAHALFAENLATNYTPEWWLAEHGWTNDFDAAALADDEPDGFPTWQE